MQNDSLTLATASTIPSEWYNTSYIAEAERRTVFSNYWICVGRVDQVTKPGDYFTTELAKDPILVVRDAAGTLRAFYNVCRHRAARVMTEPCGNATKLRCPYHGWTYDLEGKLRGLPEFDGVQNFTREENGLQPLAVDTWGPLVFIHQGKPTQTLAEQLAPMPSMVSKFGIDQLSWVGRKEYTLACNWKVFVDNYLDGGYHVHSIHPSLASVLDYKNYKTDCFPLSSVQSSPLKAPDANDDTSAANVRKGAEAAYWWLFPNLMINLYSGVMDTNLVLPLDADHCKVIFDFYFPTSERSEEDKVRHQESIKVADQIQAEDVGVCEDVQKGLHSRAFDTGRYSVRREQGVYEFHQLLKSILPST